MFVDVFTSESWNLAAGVLFRAGIATILGGVIGWEREYSGKPSGVRTHMLVALGTVLFTEVGREIGGDPARIAAQVVTGIGFLGAGTIMRMGLEVRGLTTAASVWATAAIAMAISIGGAFLIVGVIGTGLTLVTLALVDNFTRKIGKMPYRRHLSVNLVSRDGVHDVLSQISSQHLDTRSVQVIDEDAGIVLNLVVEGSSETLLECLTHLPSVRTAKWVD